VRPADAKSQEIPRAVHEQQRSFKTTNNIRTLRTSSFKGSPHIKTVLTPLPEILIPRFQDAGPGAGYEYVPNKYFLLLLSKHNIYFDDTDKSLADTQAGDRQTGRKAQLSNITAAKT